jgi:hypothetical protein
MPRRHPWIIALGNASATTGRARYARDDDQDESESRGEAHGRSSLPAAGGNARTVVDPRSWDRDQPAGDRGLVQADGDRFPRISVLPVTDRVLVAGHDEGVAGDRVRFTLEGLLAQRSRDGVAR